MHNNVMHISKKWPKGIFARGFCHSANFSGRSLPIPTAGFVSCDWLAAAAKLVHCKNVTGILMKRNQGRQNISKLNFSFNTLVRKLNKHLLFPLITSGSGKKEEAQ